MREDTSRVALKAVRNVIDAAHDFELEIAGRTVRVVTERGPSSAWPGQVEGVDEATDGPWPVRTRLHCAWAGGHAELELRPAIWRPGEDDRQNVAIQIDLVSPYQLLLWIDVGQQVRQVEDGATAPLSGAVSLMVRKGESRGARHASMVRRLDSLVSESGLPMVTPRFVDVGGVEVPGGEILPSESEAYERLVHVALLKYPFMARGLTGAQEGEALLDLGGLEPDVDAEPEPDGVTKDGRLAGLYPFPGGVRRYKQTLDELLAWLEAAPRREQDFREHLRERYDTTGDVAMRGYQRLLLNTGLAETSGGVLTLTAKGEGYRADPTADRLFDILDSGWIGFLETLLVAERAEGARTRRTRELLVALLGVDWKSVNQAAFRRNWLLSLGLVDRTTSGDVLTDAGHEVLARKAERAGPLRIHLDEILKATGDEVVVDEDMPPGWGADRLDMLAEQIEAQVEELVLDPRLFHRAAAALSAGRHLLLVGPPGTGKTRLAHAIANAAQAEGYCTGLLPATASADWSSFEVIGGYSLQKDGSLSFRSGVFLRAIEEYSWLLIDELNRADADRAFGELMTVLSGASARTPYEDASGRFISMGSSSDHTHTVPRTFRVLATMNSWDKTSLFRLSYALQRRFAILPVEPPPASTYAKLLYREATGPGLDEPLEAQAAERVVDLFRPKALLGVRAVGPAVPLEMIRYMRRRQAQGDGLAEAAVLYLLPQLEGLAQADATRARDYLRIALDGWTSAAACREVDDTMGDMFPHLGGAEPRL